MLAALAAAIWLAGVRLPEHVGSPGEGRVAAAVGVEGGEPTGEARWGVWPFLALFAEAVWHPEAPLVGMGVRVAAGRPRRLLYATAWAEGHLRPVITTDVTQAIAGSDAAAGLGITVVAGWLVVQLDGGAQLGLPVFEVQADIDQSAVDQQGGLFATQRLRLAVQLGDHLELASRGILSLPIESVDFNRRDRDVLGRWHLRWGGQVLVRF